MSDHKKWQATRLFGPGAGTATEEWTDAEKAAVEKSHGRRFASSYQVQPLAAQSQPVKPADLTKEPAADGAAPAKQAKQKHAAAEQPAE